MISERLKYMHYCDDITKIEGYSKAIASSERYVIHHKREVQNGVQIWTKAELIKVGQYYNVDASELVFIPLSEHNSLHKNAFDPKRKCLCKEISEEQRAKQSKARLGKTPWNKGKSGLQVWTEEAKEKLRNTLAKQDVKEKMYTPERNRKIANSRLGNKYPRVTSI